MTKPRITLSHELKKQILLKLSQEDCTIQSLAAQHNVSVKTIGKWRADSKKQKKEVLRHQNNQFIELTPIVITKTISDLKKVELTFEEYSCSIVGKINSNQLLKLLQLLEGGIC